MAAQQALLAADERERYLSERSGNLPTGATTAMPTGAPTGAPMMSRPTGQAQLEAADAQATAQRREGLANQEELYAQMERAGEANRQDATYRLATGGNPAAEAQYRLATGYEPSNVPAPALGGAPALRRPSGQAELAAMEDAERAKQRVNALAPAPAPSVNAMVDPATAIRNEIVRLDMTYPGGAAKREIGMLETQLKELEKRYVVPNVGMVTGGGRTIVEAGIAPTDIKKLISERDKLAAGDPNRKVYDQAIADIGAQARIAQQRLAFDQTKFAWEKANPGFELKEAEDGSIVGVNKRTLQAFPVSIGGAAPAAPMAAGETPTANVIGTPLKGKGKEPPAKFNDTDLQLAGLAGSLKEFKNEVNKNLFTGASFLPAGADTRRMQAKYTSLLMGVKDLYTLGALTGPDMSIIESQLTNPASWTGKITTKEGFKEQIQVIEDMLKRSTTNLENTYSRTPKAAREALKGLPSGTASGISGATANDPLGLGVK